MEVPEVRTDWLTGRTVIAAENRAQRPNEFTLEVNAVTGAQNLANLALAEIGLRQVPGVPSCPFCIGNESRTPPAVYERFDAEGRWQVRVVPNMYPAVTAEVAATDESAGPGADEPATSITAHGAHELIIESAQHVDRTSALSEQEMQQVLEAYVDRLRFWQDDKRFNYGLVFKNQGPRAGASIAHLHSQFLALPAAPPAVAAEIGRADEYFAQYGSCAYCRLIERERTTGDRIVLEHDGYIAFCPYASLQPYETWLFPADHAPAFEHSASGKSLEAIAAILQALIHRLERQVPDGAYNMLLRTAPWAGCDEASYHWRIELLPRVNAFAGFEIGTGVHINPVTPEKAARQLRSI